jgi:hypothetical protein
MGLAPDKMELHIQVLGQYLGVETSHPLYQKVCPDDHELLLNNKPSKKRVRKGRYLLWFVKWSYALPKPSEPVLFVSNVFLYFKLEYSFKHIYINLLFPLANAAAATTSSTRSRTTGEVLGEERSSSRVSRNFRDVD